ncbi:hypothetical protein F0562_012906 [Nyssa sinensis]|uniref:Uncharacterized protein n=1 Tax=Nyssa sinensis TaxID=561372 RepID=A0A5J4ZTW8_9ASTE|nr:hypothetical protein F0562_012906 [Nyssa sinensis]
MVHCHHFRLPKKANKTYKPEFKVESYQIQKQGEWTECPLALQICGREVKRSLKCNSSVSSNGSGSEQQLSPKLDLSHFVFHLEGDEALVDLMENNCDVTDHWIWIGKKKLPKYLIQLSEKSASSHEFKGVGLTVIRFLLWLKNLQIVGLFLLRH